MDERLKRAVETLAMVLFQWDPALRLEVVREGAWVLARVTHSRGETYYTHSVLIAEHADPEGAALLSLADRLCREANLRTQTLMNVQLEVLCLASKVRNRD